MHGLRDGCIFRSRLVARQAFPRLHLSRKRVKDIQRPFRVPRTLRYPETMVEKEGIFTIWLSWQPRRMDMRPGVLYDVIHVDTDVLRRLTTPAMSWLDMKTGVPRARPLLISVLHPTMHVIPASGLPSGVGGWGADPHLFAVPSLHGGYVRSRLTKAWYSRSFACRDDQLIGSVSRDPARLAVLLTAGDIRCHNGQKRPTRSARLRILF